ncbi:putative oxidoreductase [Novosphingobium kunmingense]|uniref:Putative oxidoreductase n=1 Tax=Novosphingobium kunmingense TaxID=1211806 RepID=A0A2N0HKR1_9SPHN|nr:SDR family NAD(P)-dependent oxidoreductase [Novosphingobium kunmingense]PKB19458.1 putative oxidoreductase [Novosphingobium kunmingense]
MKPSGNTILFTGGGSGIGRELARELADRGNTVIVAGRRLGALEETCAGRPSMHAHVLDVSDAAGVARGVEELLARYPAINVLVNNAGIMDYEDVTNRRDLSAAASIIETNLLAPIRLTDALIEHLSAQQDAAIVNTTSGLAFVPLPKAPTYSATKAALHSYSVSLRAMLAGKVRVIELIPPAVQTELTPGQSSREGYLPLATYIDQVMAQYGESGFPDEVLVPNAKVLREAEKNDQFEQVLAMLSRL